MATYGKDKKTTQHDFKKLYNQAKNIKLGDIVMVTKLCEDLSSKQAKLRFNAQKKLQGLSAVLEMAVYIQLEDSRDPELQYHAKKIYQKYFPEKKKSHIYVPKLKLPHVVEDMDTIKVIAEMYDSDEKWIMDVNGIKNDVELHKRKQIMVPVENLDF